MNDPQLTVGSVTFAPTSSGALLSFREFADRHLKRMPPEPPRGVDPLVAIYEALLRIEALLKDRAP